MNDTGKKHKVFVGIGSNIDQHTNIKNCLENLRQKFNNLQISNIYESLSMGFDGPNFYNLAASFDTDLDLNTLKDVLNQIEIASGRQPTEEKYSSRTLDIDILYYDDVINLEMNIPRSEIEDYDFVLRPLYELEPYHIHPVTLKSHYVMINQSIFKKMIINQIDINTIDEF